MVVEGKKVQLMKAGIRILLRGNGGCGRRDARQARIQFGKAESIAQAGRPALTEKLVKVEIERALAVIERLWGGCRSPHLDYANVAMSIRLEPLARNSGVRARSELLLQRQRDHIKGLGANRTGGRFRDQAAKGLVESSDLRRFELKALVETDAAERARI